MAFGRHGGGWRATILASVLALAGCEEPEPSNPPPPGPCVPTVGEVCTALGDGSRGNNGQDLDARGTWLFLPSAATLDPDGRVVVVDYNNLLLRRLDDDGVARTVAGNGGHSYAIDGVDVLDCPLENPVDADYGPDGSLYINEQHGARILRADLKGWLTVYAGSPDQPGYDCYTGDGGPARSACMSQSSGVTVGDDGSVYVADTGNNVIRVVYPDGTIDTLAGSGVATYQDGVGDGAALSHPWSMTFADGWLYVADRENSAIRRIDPATGEVTTVAGTGTRGYSGDGGPAVDAALSGPLGLDMGPDGALYVADSENNVIRKIDVDGIITTVAGIPGEYPKDFAADGGDGGPPLEARFNWPNDVLVTPTGDVYVVDTFDDRVRVIPGLAAAD
ncbi:MAG: hypothetical protein ABMB14_18845 [Myxococcota bacterium]